MAKLNNWQVIATIPKLDRLALKNNNADSCLDDHSHIFNRSSRLPQYKGEWDGPIPRRHPNVGVGRVGS
jgi:hypothetical protein